MVWNGWLIQVHRFAFLKIYICLRTHLVIYTQNIEAVSSFCTFRGDAKQGSFLKDQPDMRGWCSVHDSKEVTTHPLEHTPGHQASQLWKDSLYKGCVPKLCWNNLRNFIWVFFKVGGLFHLMWAVTSSPWMDICCMGLLNYIGDDFRSFL